MFKGFAAGIDVGPLEVQYSGSPLIQYLDPSSFQNVILGFLALLVPISIAFLSEILRIEGAEKKFQLRLVFSEVFNYWLLTYISVATLFFFSFFSIDSSHQWKIGSIIVLVLYFLFVIFPTIKINRYIHGDKDRFEKKYIKNLKFTFWSKNDNDLVEKLFDSWQAIWGREKLKYKDEEEYTGLFIAGINNALKYEYFELSIRLLKNYLKDIEKRNEILITNNIFPNLLQWGEKGWNNRNKKDRELNFPPYSIDSYYNDFFVKIVTYILKSNHRIMLFKDFGEFVDKMTKKMEKEQEYQKTHHGLYKTIIHNFCFAFFDLVSRSRGDSYGWELWEGDYPKTWTINYCRLQNNDIFIIQILNNYFDWIRENLNKNAISGINNQINELSVNLFPTASPSTFGCFLNFVFNYNDRDIESLEKLLEDDISMGFHMDSFSSIFAADSENEAITRQERLLKEKDIETYNIISWLFSNQKHFRHINIEYLENAKKQAIELSKMYQEESRQKNDIDLLIEIINEILVRIGKNNTPTL